MAVGAPQRAEQPVWPYALPSPKAACPDGFGACRQIRAAFEASATDYLAKPFTSSQLRARLRACLLRSR